MTEKIWKSPNFDVRKGGVKPSLIILHYTGMKSAEEALARLCDADAKVSAHYVIEEDGRVHALVGEESRAWHAGVSYWRGETDINSISIGIEIVNPGHEYGYRVFPDAQVTAVIDLCREIMGRHDIAPENVLGHSDIAPSRKEDPGELFPWQRLAAQGVGVFPAVAEKDGAVDAEELKKLLVQYGYNGAEKTEDLIRVFHRHFYPENLNSSPNKKSLRIAQALIENLPD